MHRNGPGGWSTGIAFLLLLALHACVPRQALSEGEPEAGRLSQGEELAGIQSTATLDGKDNLRVEVEGTIQYPFQQRRDTVKIVVNITFAKLNLYFRTL